MLNDSPFVLFEVRSTAGDTRLCVIPEAPELASKPSVKHLEGNTTNDSHIEFVGAYCTGGNAKSSIARRPYGRHA